MREVAVVVSDDLHREQRPDAVDMVVCRNWEVVWCRCIGAMCRPIDGQTMAPGEVCGGGGGTGSMSSDTMPSVWLSVRRTCGCERGCFRKPCRCVCPCACLGG